MNTIFITPVDTEDDGDVPKIKLGDMSSAGPFTPYTLVVVGFIGNATC